MRIGFLRVAIAGLISLVIAVVGLFFNFNFGIYTLFLPSAVIVSADPFWPSFLVILTIQAISFLIFLVSQVAGLGFLWGGVKDSWMRQRVTRSQWWLVSGLVAVESLLLFAPVAEWTFSSIGSEPHIIVVALTDIPLGLLAMALVSCTALAWVGKQWGWLATLLIPLVGASLLYPMSVSPILARYFPLFQLLFNAVVATSLFVGLAFTLFGLSRDALHHDAIVAP